MLCSNRLTLFSVILVPYVIGVFKYSCLFSIYSYTVYKRAAADIKGEFGVVKYVEATQYFITDRSRAVVLLWFSVTCFWCQSFGDVSHYMCVHIILVRFGLLIGHLLGNSCSLG